MSRYGVYSGNTSISTSTTGETITDDEDDAELRKEVSQTGGLDSIRRKSVAEQELGAASGRSTIQQSTTASAPVFELPFESSPLDPLSLASALSLQSGETLTPLERFAFNALIEHYCAQQVSLYLSPKLPHHIHDSYKNELYRRVTASFGMTGGFDREEFKGVRESILEGISAVVNSEMVNIIQQTPISPTSPQVEYTAATLPDFENIHLDNCEGNEVVRRAHRPKSFENLAPLSFVQANRRLAACARPATSDGKKPGSFTNHSRGKEGGDTHTKRPELMRAMSFDTLQRAVKGPKTPLAPTQLSRGQTFDSPRYRPKTPQTSSHPFRHYGYCPAPPPPTRERESKAQVPYIHKKPYIRRNHNFGTIRASVSLQQQTVHTPPMDRSLSADRALSRFLPQLPPPPQQPHHSLQGLVSHSSRYKTDFIELDFLGKGGFASVYKVRNILDGREYAIKKVPIRNRHLRDTKGQKLDVVFKEIKTLAKLEHKNVVRYYGAWVESATGLWEPASEWPRGPQGNAVGDVIGRSMIGKELTFGYPETVHPKSGPIVREIPVLGSAAFINDEELNAPDPKSAIEGDSMGIHFGEDTAQDSDSSKSLAKIIITPNKVDISSSDTEASDIEIIPRIPPPLPTQIPLPVSPQFPTEYFRQRRQSFVSDVDRDGNEIGPFSRNYCTVSESDSGLGQGESPPPQANLKQIIEGIGREKEKEHGARHAGVFEDESREEESKATTDGEETSIGIKGLGEKHVVNQQPRIGNLKNGHMTLVQADRLARSNSDKKEVLTLMIMMGVHPLTLREFLSRGGSVTNSSQVQNLQVPRLGIELQPHHTVQEKGRYCWHVKCALKIFRGILEGTEYLHNNGVVHRDLKPGNIFMNIEGGEIIMHTRDDCRYCNVRCALVPRIGDFGLVAELVDGVSDKQRGSNEQAVESGDEKLRGNVVGTALYRPPPSTTEGENATSSSDEEVTSGASTGGGCMGTAISPRDRLSKNVICAKTDVYALGIIFFELLYKCGTGSERIKCLVELREMRKLPCDWTERVRIGGGVGLHVVDVVARCILGMTEKRRSSRWGLQRVKEALRELDEFCGEE